MKALIYILIVLNIIMAGALAWTVAEIYGRRVEPDLQYSFSRPVGDHQTLRR